MFKVDEEFFDLELDDDFFQDAFNVTTKTSQPSVTTGSPVLFKPSDLEYSAASKNGCQELSEAQAENKCKKVFVCVSDGPSKEQSNVLQNEINVPMGQLDKRQLSNGVTTVKDFPCGDSTLTVSRRGFSPDHLLSAQPGGIAASAVCVDKENNQLSKTSLSRKARSGNNLKLPFISYNEGEDLNAVFSFESVKECSTFSEAVENRALKGDKPQLAIPKKCTQQEGRFSGKDLSFSLVTCASPLKKVISSDNLFLHSSNSELSRTPISAVNVHNVKVNSKSTRPMCIQNTPTVCKSVSLNDLSPGTSSNMRSNQSTPRNKFTPITRKRKFPGPAGILPELPLGADLSALSEPESPIISVSPKDAAPQDFVCSQSLVDEFEKQPWQMMLKDVACEGSSASVMDNFNISWVLQQANSKQLPKGKVPVLCIILKNLSFQGSEARVTFADKTGEMGGMIHGKLLEEYQDKLQPGAVLVLKQVTVFSPSSRKHYLVITPSNIICLYGVPGDKTSVISCSGAELMAMAEEWMQEVTKAPRIGAGGSMQLISSCVGRETFSRSHVNLQRSNNSAQQWPGENFSLKHTSFASGTSLSLKENQKNSIALPSSVTGGSHSMLNPGPCSTNRISFETVIADNTGVQPIVGNNNCGSSDCAEQQPLALGTDSEEESAVFEDGFDDLFSSLDDEALPTEKW